MARRKASRAGNPGEGREIVYVRDGETAFLNVDLDLLSTAPLEPLVSAFGKRVVVLYVGGERRRYEAHLELASLVRTADVAIRRLVDLVESLPRPARRAWNGARSRVFNIGIQAGHEPFSREWLVSEATVAAAARVRGSIIVTVYAAERHRSSEGAVSAMKIGSIVIHCHEFDRTVAFWKAALHYVPREPGHGGWIVLRDPSGKGPNLSFQARDRRRPRRNWIHLDLYTHNQEAEAERLVSLGAARYPWRYPPGADYIVLQDPDGNLFCVVQKADRQAG
jgi:catechol 2,3-dioxygenase-like lactoylglutathione lyase family enzyme